MNTELFAKIRDIIREHPEQHDQYTWESQSVEECGTTRCVAGWAVHLTTGQPLYTWQPGEEIRLSDVTIALAREKGVYVEDPKDSGAVPDLAVELLGLNEREANLLFYADNVSAEQAVIKAADGDQYGFQRVLDSIESGD